MLLLFGLVLPPGPVAADGHAAYQAFEVVAPAGHGDRFGEALAWHGDTLVVGAPNSDVVQVLAVRDGRWTIIQTLTGEDRSDFGEALAIHDDLLVVGAPGRSDGTIHVYRHNGAGWGLLDSVTSPGPDRNFGAAVAVHGDWIAAGDPTYYIEEEVVSEGNVYLFKVGASSVELKATFSEGDLLRQRNFGNDIAISDDVLVVGAPGVITDETINSGAAYVYTRAGNTWTESTVLESGLFGENSGYGGTVAVAGGDVVICHYDNVNVNADYASLYVYRRSGASWGEVQRDDDVGCYAVVADDDNVVTAGYGDPDLRVWRRSGDRWVDDVFGENLDTDDMALEGGRVALGFPRTYGGRVVLVGPNEAPVAATDLGDAPIDLDGDGEEVVLLDGSNSTDDAPGLEHHWYRLVEDAPDEYLGAGETLAVTLPVGDHLVRLAVSDADLGTDQTLAVASVLPAPPPQVGFSWLPKDAASLEPMRFVDESTSEYGHVTSWSWDFDGDGEADATGPTPSWTFEEPGRHPVTLTVGTDVNTEASLTQKVRVRNLAPEAHAGMDQILEDADGDGKVRVTLDGSESEDADGELDSFRWSRNGRFAASGATASLDLAPGVHDIDLTVTDDLGAKDTDRVTFLILEQDHNNTVSGPGPSARYDFAPAAGPPARAVQFTDRSTDPDGRVIMWWYDVGDDGTWDYTEPSPLVGFDAYGGHDVRLRVTDDEGQQNDYVQNVFLRNGAPTAIIEARATSAFVGQQVVFVDNSTDPEAGPLERTWDFGDGATGTEQAPSHVYTAAGTYTVKLTVTDEGEKSDEATLQVTVSEVPEGVTVPAVAGSPHTPQAADSPFAPGADDGPTLVDTDGDGEGDTPLDEVLSEDTGTRTDDAGAGSGREGVQSQDGPSPPAYIDPSKPWLWVLLGALLVALVGSAWAAFRA